MKRIATSPFLRLCTGLALGAALAGCGSTSGSGGALNRESARAQAAGERQAAAEQRLQQQVTPPLDAPLRIVGYADARYPSHLISDLTREAQAAVTVSFEVMPSGLVGAAQVLPGAAHEGLHQPAVDAIRRWRFAPPLREGKPVRLQLQHTFDMHRP